MRTETGQDVIAAAVEILSEHAKGVVVSPEALDWALSIAIANIPPQQRADIVAPQGAAA